MAFNNVIVLNDIQEEESGCYRNAWPGHSRRTFFLWSVASREDQVQTPQSGKQPYLVVVLFKKASVFNPQTREYTAVEMMELYSVSAHPPTLWLECLWFSSTSVAVQWNLSNPTISQTCSVRSTSGPKQCSYIEIFMCNQATSVYQPMIFVPNGDHCTQVPLYLTQWSLTFISEISRGAVA